jgi:hypothetical protein
MSAPPNKPEPPKRPEPEIPVKPIPVEEPPVPGAGSEPDYFPGKPEGGDAPPEM